MSASQSEPKAEQFSFACPFCDNSMRAPLSAVGKSGRCKQCRNVVLVPKPKPLPSAEPLPSTFIPADKPWPWSILYATAGMTCLIGWMVTAENDVTPADYLLLIGACGSLWLTLTRITKPLIAHPAGAIVLLSCVGLYGWNDTTRYQFANDQGADIVETYARWGGRPIKKSIVVYSEDGSIAATAEGSLAESGSNHGEWTLIIYDPEFLVRTEHYWYGEKVSEAEFHRLNNR
jgi:hypothetical protein